MTHCQSSLMEKSVLFVLCFILATGSTALPPTRPVPTATQISPNLMKPLQALQGNYRPPVVLMHNYRAQPLALGIVPVGTYRFPFRHRRLWYSAWWISHVRYFPLLLLSPPRRWNHLDTCPNTIMTWIYKINSKLGETNVSDLKW